MEPLQKIDITLFNSISGIALNSIDQIIFVIDKDYKIIYLNTRCDEELRKRGYSGDFLNQNIKELFTFLPPNVWDEYQKVFQTGESLATEEQHNINGEQHNSEVQKITVKIKNEIQIITIVKDITAHKSLSESQQELEQTYGQIINIFPNGGILTYDKNFRYLVASGSDLNNMGLSQSKLIGKSFYDIFPNGICKVIEPAYVDSLKGKETKLEIEFRNKWYRTINIPNRNTKGDIIGGLVMMQDITEPIEKNRLLKESEEKFKKAFYTSPDSININKFDGTYVDINHGFTMLTGYTAEDVIGKSSEEIQIWNKKEDREKLIEGLTQSGMVENLETDFRLKNGDIKTGLMSAKIVNINGENHILSITRDISERTKLQKMLKESEWKYRSTFEAIQEGLWEFDLISDKGYFSDSYYRMLGYKPGEIENTNEKWRSLTHPDDAESASKAVQEHLEGKTKEFSIEYRVKNKSENWQWLKIKGRIMEYTADGKPKRILGAAEDIDAIKKYESEILEQNKILREKNSEIEEMLERLQMAKEKAEESDRLKSLFLNNMSHEIRTPMNGILGFADFLDDPETTTEKRGVYINIIKNNSAQLLKIIDDILEMSSLETKQVKPHIVEVCMNDIIVELFSLYSPKAKEKGIPLYVKNDLSISESTILTDKIKIQKVISNIVDNALRFTNTGYVEMGCEIKNDEFRIYVKDTGIGIPETHTKMIFERFAQGDKETSIKTGGGLGIGLSIAKENTELLGGRIEVESEIEKGSKFIITLPITQAGKKNVQVDREKKKKYKTLVAEDEEINFFYIETLLTQYFKDDCEILHAKNGVEVVDMFMESSPIDLILMDIKMPLMDGYEATKQIKKESPETCIIAQTAYSTKEDIEKALSAGFDDFLSKPIREKLFREIIEKHVTVK